MDLFSFIEENDELFNLLTESNYLNQDIPDSNAFTADQLHSAYMEALDDRDIVMAAVEHEHMEANENRELIAAAELFEQFQHNEDNVAAYEDDHIDDNDKTLINFDDVELIDDEIMQLFSTIEPQQQSGQTGGAREIFQVTNQIEQNCPKFDCKETLYTLKINIVNKTFAEAVEDLRDMFEQLCDRFVRTVPRQNKIKIIFEHSDFKSPIWLPFMHPEDITPELIQTKFDMIVQSYKLKNSKITEACHFTARVINVNLPAGSGRIVCKEKRFIKNFEEFLHNCPSIKVVKNKDELCFLRALVIAIAFESKNKAAKNLYYRQNGPKFQKELDHIKAATGITRGPCGLPEIRQAEDRLKEYQIMVLNGNQQFHLEPIYLNRTLRNKKCLYLCLHEHHYYVITSMCVFLNVDYYCHVCKVGFKKRGAHKCDAVCEQCKRLNCVEIVSVFCQHCKQKCKNEQCFHLHQQHECTKVSICNVCNQRKLRQHVCGDDEKWCPNCKKSVKFDHKCFIMTEDEKAKTALPKHNGYIFFDYECYVNTMFHVPNLIIARKCCVKCLNSDQVRCDDCSQIYKFDSNDDFCTWLLTHEYWIAMAHNMKGYDGIFIANWCINNLSSNDVMPQLITTPTKILQMKFRKLKIIDSYSFLAMPLEKFPKTFDIPELKKGFFPYNFNTADNANYVGPYPDKEFYTPDYFTASKRAEFELFYEQNKHNVYDHKKEMEEYCISDVNILMEGCLKFRKIILEQTKRNDEDIGVDPFLSCITIASLSNLIFRRNYMQPNSIGIIPDNGYNPRQQTSRKCQLYIKYYESILYTSIQSSLSPEGEKQIGKYFVDGYSEDARIIIEFHGCYW